MEEIKELLEGLFEHVIIESKHYVKAVTYKYSVEVNEIEEGIYLVIVKKLGQTIAKETISGNAIIRHLHYLNGMFELVEKTEKKLAALKEELRVI